MSPSSRFLSLVLASALLFGVGFVCGRSSGPTKPIQSATAQDAGRPGGMSGGVAGVQSTEPRKIALEPPRDPDSPLASLQAVLELNRRATRPLFSFSISRGNQLNDDFCVAFAVTETEKAALKAAFAATKAGISRIEADLARIEPRSDGGFTISIPPYPREGGELYDRFVATVQATLGPERSAYMQEMHLLDTERFFDQGQFGLLETKFEIRPPESPVKGGNWSTGLDPQKKMVMRTGELDRRALQDLFPLLYARLPSGGAAVPGKP